VLCLHGKPVEALLANDCMRRNAEGRIRPLVLVNVLCRSWHAQLSLLCSLRVTDFRGRVSVLLHALLHCDGIDGGESSPFKDSFCGTVSPI
jgi:hypothetical protein